MNKVTLSVVAKVSLIIAGCLILVAVVGVGLLLPQYDKFVQIEQDRLDTEAQLLAAQTLLSRRTELKNNEADLLADISAQKEQVPDEPGISEVVRSLQDIAYDNGHWMTNVSNEEPTQAEGEKFNAWNVTITVEGTWLDTISYLRDLRDMSRKVRINNVTTSMAGKLNETNRSINHWDPGKYACVTTIECTVYYIPPENMVEKKEAPAAEGAEGATTNAAEGGAQ